MKNPWHQRKNKQTLQQQVRCIFRWMFTVDICLARGEPLYKKSMSVPMNKWWADEDCSSSCPICTLRKPLKWLKFSGKSELCVWSRLPQRRLFGLFWIILDYEGLWFSRSVITRGCSWFCTEFWVKLCIAEHTVFLLLRWSTRALSQSDFHWGYSFSECHWAPTKDQCDGLLKWREF